MIKTAIFILLLPIMLLGSHGTTYAQDKKTDTKDSTQKIDPYTAQNYLYEVPFNRSYFHDKIDRECKRADLFDGKLDSFISFKPDLKSSGMLTQAIIKDAGWLQVLIENMPDNGRDSFVMHQDRIRYLNAVWELLRNYNNDPYIDPLYYKKLVANMKDMLIACNENKLMEFAKVNANVFTLNNGKGVWDVHKDVRAWIYTKMGQLDPKMMIRRLEEYANDTFAEAIIKADARLEPDLTFSYASSINPPLYKALHKAKDPFVKTIVRIADHSKSPVKAMPFLGEIYSGRKTIEEVDSIANNPDLYFVSLVELRVNNDSLGRSTYTCELGHRALGYVRKMNELHEEKDTVRFKCIEQMTPVDMYYILVLGQDEIYTSSFLGTFKRMMEKMKPIKGNELLQLVHQDHFRTFIRMCAGYNTLNDFLASMDDSTRNPLMAEFIAGLEKGRDDDLEDAVDVADAFGSITDTAMASFLSRKVKENYELSYTERSKKGLIVYSLLSRLFESLKITGSDTAANWASKRIGLPNINKVAFKDLIDDSGTVYQQLFFFGDEDGLHSYEHFTDLFRKDSRWKWEIGKYWSTISSTTGSKIVIYANLPLATPDDDMAIDSLCHYLYDTGIHPTIMIHRGHSYHLPVTLEKLGKQAMVVVLGSCGGYHNLGKVLEKSPSAHIISSKQTGTKDINDEILKSMNNTLIAGNDLNWINLWRDVEDVFANSKNRGDIDKFSDYVPPYKNLGAIFIKAYRRMMWDY